MLNSPSPRSVFLATALGLAGFTLAACSGNPSTREEAAATVRDLDSLHRVAQHEDSVNANLYFYEDAFVTYQKTHPAVTKAEFMEIAQGKDKAFCLFQPDAGNSCLKVGDQFHKLALKEPALDAYEAGLLSQTSNGDALNIQLWSSLAQLHFDAGESGKGRPYLAKILAVDPKNKWAKKRLTSASQPNPVN